MSETTSSANATDDAGIDLSQFHQIFFEEAAENLDNMEQLLLGVNVDAASDDDLNAIFRCAHSIKGGAATFGFTEVADLTHKMETLLDKLRRHELQPTSPMVDALLSAGDALRSQLAIRQGSSDVPVDVADLLARITAFSGAPVATGPELAPKSGTDESRATGQSKPAAKTRSRPKKPGKSSVKTATRKTPGDADSAADGARMLELVLQASSAPGVLELFADISGLGEIEPLADRGSDSTLRHFRLKTTSTDEELLDLMSFHVAREAVQLIPFTQEDDAFSTASPPAGPEPAGPAGSAPLPPPVVDNAVRPSSAKPHTATSAGQSLRVSVEKIDQLINLTGELVITQTMLAQSGAELDESKYAKLINGLAQLDRNMRDLQEAVMSIRMIPMSVVFSRFPRMLHDLAGKLGKKVELVTEGEATELDKGLMEKITDPLTHLVRNSCDHGIEQPEERRAAGKPETGTITLSASHQGGNIVIEVKDDGKGLDRDKLLAKARDRGLDAPQSLSDSEVWNLIFAPGFSTAEQVTDVSGRGVGMDVVKSNITALGGSVEINSTKGVGMSVKVRLPLTLAIMESISVGVAGECYILPLSTVVESFQPAEGQVKTVRGKRLVQIHDEYLPILDLEQIYGVPRVPAQQASNPLMVVVESQGTQTALLVDEILGQQQVVVKNLEANFRRVRHVAGATITGSGSVALIADVDSLVRSAVAEQLQ